VINNVNHFAVVPIAMAANALVTTRIDPVVKDEASAVLAALGLTVSDAVRLLLTKVAQEGALPFSPVAPGEHAIAKVRRVRAAKATMSQRRVNDVGAVTLIPETTPQRYLSGVAALNLPSTNGTGDWHLIETFFKPKQKHSRLFIAGVGCAGDTTSLLGERGVFECSSLLDELKIPHPTGPAYAANHARAIADMVLVAILDGGSPDFVQLDDWMPGDDDKQAVIELLNYAMPKLNAEQQQKVIAWLKNSY